LKYSIHGTDKNHVSVSGSTVTYHTNLKEPRTLSYTLRVHAQGDGINGKSHYQDFASTIKIQGCDNENNVISNPHENAWKTDVKIHTPKRGTETLNVG
jgi:hypothetical protein